MRPDEQNAILDQIIDEILAAWNSGQELDPGVLASAHPALRSEIERALGLVRETATYGAPRFPSIAGYRVMRPLGRGGMGRVYLAEHAALGRRVALKVLAPEASLSPHARRRFQGEARALAQLRHEHVVAIHEAIESGDVCAYAMEWIDGCSLAEALAARPRTPAEVAAIGIGIGRALGAVHRAGLLHRDVKPSNILLRGDGKALLSDFGLARDDSDSSLTRTGHFVGTAAYASPEQRAGAWDRVGPASDLWSLGATLKHALGGVRAPRDLATILTACVAEEPSRRYANADALADDLLRFARNEPIRARPPSLAYRAAKLVRRNRAHVVAAGAAAVLALGASLAFGYALLRRLEVPQEVNALVVRAHLHLLEPRHEERLVRTAHGIATEPELGFGARVDRAPALFGQALALQPNDDALRLEAEVVEVARALREGRVHSLSPLLCADCPQTAAFAAGEAPSAESLAGATASDRRLLGLLAYLLGRGPLACDAWQGADLSPGAPDPFVDAAAGQLLRQQERHAAAYPRLWSAVRAFPEAGFLWMALADTACQLGDIDHAEDFLAHGEACAWQDGLGTDALVRAELLARRGRLDEARPLFETVIRGSYGYGGRLRYASALEAGGDPVGAAHWLLDLAERAPRDAALAVRCLDLLRRGWSGKSVRQRFDDLVTMLLDPAHAGVDCGRARGLVIAARNAGPRTVAMPDSSWLDIEASLRDLAPPLEVSRMHEQSAFRLSPVSARFAAAILLVGDAARGRVPPTLRPLVERGTRAAFLAVIGLATGAASLHAQTVWQPISPPGSLPAGRLYGGMAYDSGRQRAVAFGGWDLGQLVNDTWEWDGTAWNNASPSLSPSPRSGPNMVYDAARGVVLLFGGSTDSGFASDTWTWDGTTWTQLSPATSPGPRSNCGITYDEARARVVLYGGAVGPTSMDLVDETWEWDGTNWQQRFPAAAPSPRYVPGMAFDSRRNLIVLYGGDYNAISFGDTWEYDGNDWVQCTPVASPPALDAMAMSYDVACARVVLFGGASAATNYNTDTWEYHGATWTQVNPPVAPSGRYGHHMVFDTANQHVLMFGGRISSTTVVNDLWELTPTTPARAIPYGTGCSGSSGVPVLSATAGAGNLPWIGDPFSMQIASLPASPLGTQAFMIGVSKTQWNSIGLPLDLGLLGWPGCLLQASLEANLGPGSRVGTTATTSISIPVEMPVGIPLFVQGVILDLSVPTVITSNGLELVFGVR